MNPNFEFLSHIKNRKILFGILSWGLGHASRSLPLIKELSNHNQLCIASDGLASSWLQDMLPAQEIYELPGYNIRYDHESMWINIAKASPHLYKTIQKERIVVDQLIQQQSFDLIISDHRFGFRSEKIHSIFIGHQLLIPHPSPMLSKLATKIQKSFIQKFDECWIPDMDKAPGLAGKMSRFNPGIPFQFIGPHSHMSTCHDQQLKYDIGVILSGPEPSRSLLEIKLCRSLSKMGNLVICFLRGTDVAIPDDFKYLPTATDIYNLADTAKINEVLCTASIVISRSGYSTIMDLYKTRRKAILIPTPNHPEQLYLARLHSASDMFFFMKESEISTLKLKEALRYLSK